MSITVVNSDSSQIVHAINRCIHACSDGAKGYAAAAVDVRDAELKKLLQTYADQRFEYVSQLRKAVESLGASPESEGSATGAVHRGLIDVRLAIEGRSDHLVLEECVRGDEAALHAFERALTNMLDGMTRETRMLVQGIYGSIRTTLDEIQRRLRMAAP